MKMAKKLLAVAMVLSMVAAFTAIAFAASPSVSFSVGDYADGKATVAVSLVDCVDLTSGSLNFGYETEKVSKILKKNGTDAKAIGDIDNAFNSEFNADTNPAEFGFYFKNKLWDNDAWKEAADELGQDDVVNGASFECAQFVFTAEAGAVITVTGELKFGETAVAVNKTFKIGKGESVVETTTEKVPEPAEETTTEKEPEESICKSYLVKVEAKAATCTEDGNIAYYKCSVCGRTFSDADARYEITNVVIKAKGHDWTDWTIAKVATLTDGKGSRSYYRTCKVCGVVETKSEKDNGGYYIGGDDGCGKTIIGIDPINNMPIIGYDESGNPIYSPIIIPPRPIIYEEVGYYVGGRDCNGETILGFDPLTGWAIVGYNEFGDPIFTKDPNARRSVLIDGNTTAISSSSSVSNSGTAASGASSSAGTRTSSSTSTVSASVKTDGGKKTGDNGVLAVLAGVVALAGAAFVVTRKRK